MKLKFNFTKWIGGSLGWAAGGPLFGVLGFVAGTVIDSLELGSRKKDKTIGIFSTSLLTLIAAVLNADKPVAKSELDLVKQFLKNNFGESEIAGALLELEEIMRNDVALDDACQQIRNSLHYSTRMQLAGFLYSLAKIDGRMTRSEHEVINIIDDGIGITFNNRQFPDFASATPNHVVIAAYEQLEIAADSDIEVIKKAYRRLAVKYHPDKSIHLDGDIQKTSNEKFQQITNAYVIIKKDRNF